MGGLIGSYHENRLQRLSGQYNIHKVLHQTGYGCMLGAGYPVLLLTYAGTVWEKYAFLLNKDKQAT
jgi:hypothetical protein